LWLAVFSVGFFLVFFFFFGVGSTMSLLHCAFLYCFICGSNVIIIIIFLATQAAVANYDEAAKLDIKNHLIYSNRAAARIGIFRQTKDTSQLSLAVQDALRSISLNPSFGKGHIRHGDALLELHRYEDAHQAYQKALELDQSNSFALAGLASANQVIQSRIVDEYYTSKTIDLPVKVKYIDGVRGKGMFAKRTFNAGETILRERPIVCQQWTRNQKQALCCARCMAFLGSLEMQASWILNRNEFPTLPLGSSLQKLPEPIPCQKCQQAFYCSTKCKSLAWQEHHEILCVAGRAASLFKAHAATEADRFQLAAQLVVSLVLKVRRNAITWEEANRPFSLFARTSWIELNSQQVDDIKQKEVTKAQLRANLTVSHKLLCNTIAEVLPTDSPVSDKTNKFVFIIVLGGLSRHRCT
jgi:hypothetical protein